MPQSPSSSSSSEAERDYPPLPEPLEINWPELNSQALGCGVEDRGLRDRYQCAEYGWEDGVDRAIERVPEEIYDAHQMRAYVDADRAARATPPSLPIDFKQASEQGVPRGDAQASKEMSRDEILHVWDAYVGEPTKNLPLTDSDKLAFARAILAKANLNFFPSPHPEEGALLLGGDECGKKGGEQ